jgi:hypothetical protein
VWAESGMEPGAVFCLSLPTSDAADP